MKTLTVNLDQDSYPVYIGSGLLSVGSLLKEHISGKQVMIVSNETVAPLYLNSIKNNLADLQVIEHIIPDGETYKTIETMEGIIRELLVNKFSRNSTLIALGGGVVGDITGFAASCYQRGIPFIQVPTTLLAQVDSSVGGKTAVNHALGKNMVGAFHQPKAVIADTDVLDTLNERELVAGLAEVIKYGLIRDREFFVWLEDNIEHLLHRDSEALAYAIEVSCQNKADVVAEDEKETGIRALLNLGHTFGHAIETALQYQGWLHGEAIGLGMLMAADLSMRINWIDKATVERIQALLNRAGLPIKLPDPITTEMMLKNMAVDKKARDGKIFLILLKDISHAVIANDYDQNLLQETIDSFLSDKACQ